MSEIEIGRVGMEIAEKVFKLEFPNLDPDTKISLLERANYRELDEVIGLTAKVDLTVDALNLSLAHRRRPSIPAEAKLEILQHRDQSVLKSSSKRKRQELAPDVQGAIAIEVARHLQDFWVQQNEPLFFLPENEYQLYKFAPLEMIGWEEAKKHFAYVRPIMIMAGLDGVQRRRFHSNKELTPEADYIHEAYKQAQRVFRKTCSISSTASFYRVFSSFKERGISSSDRISDALRADDRLIFPMASQVLRHNPPGTFCPIPKE